MSEAMHERRQWRGVEESSPRDCAESHTAGLEHAPRGESATREDAREHARGHAHEHAQPHPHAQEADHFPWAFDRRDFLKLMGTSLAVSGLAGCASQPLEEILPYVRSPEEIIPGRPLFFATAMTLGGIGQPILVESHTGRPTKIEGNPEHPASLGATDVFAQAASLSLYDPDRSQTIVHRGQIQTWSSFVGALRTLVEGERESQGAGLRILTETVSSPTLARQIRELLAQFPRARWHQYEPATRDGARVGALVAFGAPVEAHYRLENADVILSLDSDFLTCGPAALAHARAFSERRRAGRDRAAGSHDGSAHGESHAGAATMNRLYVVESSPTNTGASADHRLPLRAGEIEGVARALLERVGGGALVGSSSNAEPPPTDPAAGRWLDALARDLTAHRGRSAVIAGDHQSHVVHVLAHALNQALGNAGQTVFVTDAVEAAPEDQMASLHELVAAMSAGSVNLLLILGGNPVYTSPADIGFADALQSVKTSVHLAQYFDETARHCDWHLPEAHFLEAWSDVRAHDGSALIVQPLIAPLFGGKSAHEVLGAASEQPDRSAYEIVRDTWRANGLGGADFDAGWRRAVHDGFVAGSALPPRAIAFAPRWDLAQPASLSGATASLAGGGDLELLLRVDSTIHDGRFANNSWLQELPKALTRLTWENAALIAPATARRLGLDSGDIVELSVSGRTLAAPVWIQPGHALDSVTLHLGYGRTSAGRFGTAIGANAYLLRSSDAPWHARGLSLRKTGRRATLASTQMHHTMEDRAPVRAGTLAELERDPHFTHHGHHEPPPDLSLYPAYPYEGYAWGMVIDLGACTGCSACVVACQSENNIPVVGKANVVKGRELHWLRVDRYYEGNEDNPAIYQQPLPCMHCENAPCEVVCPVGATAHSDEGLNDMVYNRCVGTRYCANNCPYKVRRFNFFQFSEQHEPSLKLLSNPDVTVRNRGVMEKCTYCVQRINSARIQAKNEDRTIRDGEVMTACQAVCPAGAIVFGDLNDASSRVAAARKSPLNYSLLAELGTRPRTTYLAAVRNPNPELAGAPGAHEAAS
jgi:molybdopterin-containing oxidoreductase family iron-sulfur binding subunit